MANAFLHTSANSRVHKKYTEIREEVPYESSFLLCLLSFLCFCSSSIFGSEKKNDVGRRERISYVKKVRSLRGTLIVSLSRKIIVTVRPASTIIFSQKSFDKNNSTLYSSSIRS